MWFEPFAPFFPTTQSRLLGVFKDSGRHAVNYNVYPGNDGQVSIASIFKTRFSASQIPKTVVHFILVALASIVIWKLLGLVVVDLR